QKNIADIALDGEIFVEGANYGSFRLDDYLVQRRIWNRAAVSDRGEARATPPTQPMVHAIAMQERSAPSARSSDSFRQHLDHRIEIAPGQITIRPGPAHQLEHL